MTEGQRSALRDGFWAGLAATHFLATFLFLRMVEVFSWGGRVTLVLVQTITLLLFAACAIGSSVAWVALFRKKD